MKKLLALALAALLIFALIGCNKQNEDTTEEENEEIVTTNVYENFTYDVNENGELEITGYENTSTELADVKIPAEIDERPIVGIRKEAFSAFKMTTSSVEEVTLFSSEVGDKSSRLNSSGCIMCGSPFKDFLWLYNIVLL